MPDTASEAGGHIRAERLEARITAEQKSLIDQAAALQGRTVTDFVLTAVQDAARRAIEDHQLELSVHDSQAFVEALLNPQPVNDRLRDTVRCYRETIGVLCVAGGAEAAARVEAARPRRVCPMPQSQMM